MMNYEILRMAAYAADDVFGRELVRVYGAKRAPEMRYAATSRHTDADLLKALDAKLAADAAYFGTGAP